MVALVLKYDKHLFAGCVVKTIQIAPVVRLSKYIRIQRRAAKERIIACFRPLKTLL